MKKFQIKELAASAVKYGGFSNEAFAWVLKNFSKSELRFFVNALAREIKNSLVSVSHAGEAPASVQKKLAALFSDKKTEFKRDDSLGAGLMLEYGDYVLDCSVRAMIKKAFRSFN